MKAFIITCDLTKDRLPNALAAATKLIKEEDIEIIDSFDAQNLNREAGENGTILWDERVHFMADILIDNCTSPSQINNCINFTQRSKLFYKNNPNNKILYSSYEWLRPRPLSPGEVSVLMKHFIAFYKIAVGPHNYGIILEDDILDIAGNENIYQSLIRFISTNQVHYIDLAGGCGLNAMNLENKLFTKIIPPRTRTNAAYLVSKELANLLICKFFPLVFPIDWHLLYFLKFYMIMYGECYWIQEPMYLHGSETQAYASWRN